MKASDIKNTRYKLRQQDRQGLTAIQSLPQLLNTKQIHYNFSVDDEGRLRYLFFALPLSEEIWKKDSKVVIIDNTYKISGIIMLLSSTLFTYLLSS
jgi:hypothetical protein